MMENNKIKKEDIFVPLIAAILIVIVGSLKIDWYFKNIMFPFIAILVSTIIIVMNNKDINKKAYFMLIPIILILASNIILGLLKSKIDESNMLLNIIVLPILMSTFFFLLTNKNYKISLDNLSLGFKLFPKDIFINLKFLKLKTANGKPNKIINVVFGLLIGILFAGFILILLTSADDYFNKFMSELLISFDIDLGNIIKLVIYFIILFSIGINIIKNKDIKMKENKYKLIDNTIIISMLSVINFVFVLFLISEISKLCGNFLQIPKGYIYSSYAREGFFQLLFVTLINFSIILYLMHKTNCIKENKIVKYLVLLLISFSILLIFNSYYRMFLYIGRFGFTILRLQVILFLSMELILFVLIIKKILKSLNNDGLIFLAVMTTFYIINLYACNDLVIKFIMNRL